MRNTAIIAIVMIGICAAGCSSQIRATGTYDHVYQTAKYAVLSSDFAIEEWATGTVGDSRETGRIDFCSIEDKGKFEPRRFVTLVIEPHDDVEVKERRLTVRGWSYGILSVPTGGIWKAHHADIQRRAADAIRATLVPADGSQSCVPSPP